jgi:hypothetical protein
MAISDFCCPGGHVDAFVSHSWSDDLDAEWASLQTWRAEFKRSHGREPLLWIDGFCLEQDDPAANLACVPLFLSGCKSLLVLWGKTYTKRLWCLFEIFVFLEIGRPMDQSQTALLSDSSEELAQLLIRATSVDATLAQCTLQEDKQKLLAALEAGFGGAQGFNDLLRSTLPNMMSSCPSSSMTAADEVVVRGVSAQVLLLHTGPIGFWSLWRLGIDCISDKEKQRLFSLSRPATAGIRVFLSHTWSTGGLCKAMHLHLRWCALDSSVIFLLIQGSHHFQWGSRWPR